MKQEMTFSRKRLEQEADTEARAYSKMVGQTFRVQDWEVTAYSGGISMELVLAHKDRRGESTTITRRMAL